MGLIRGILEAAGVISSQEVEDFTFYTTPAHGTRKGEYVYDERIGWYYSSEESQRDSSDPNEGTMRRTEDGGWEVYSYGRWRVCDEEGKWW